MQNFRETESGLVGRIAALQDKSSFKELHWEGSFEEYLKIVRDNPRVTRTAFQRIYDMILSHGKTEYIDNKKKLIRYHFFHDEHFGGRDAVFQIPARGDLCPASRLIFKDLMSEYKGDFSKVMSHVRVKRLLLSEKDRIGIGTFQPKDEKNQDSTELTGDVNYRKIAEYGSDSEPRAFNFDGEFNIANRGIIEFVEVLKKHNLTLLQKLKLYNGKTLPGFTEDNIKELRKEAAREGMEGISPRYVQDKISNALVSDKGEGCVNPFMVLNELESGLRHHSLISSEEVRKRDRELLSVVKGEYEDIVKNEVQRAISADEDAIAKLCGNYIDNIKAYTQREKVRNKYTGQYEEPDERLMRAIEEKIDIPESRKDDFRREIMNYIGALAIEGKTFNYRTNERLYKALELKLFEDQKDSIKLKNLVSSVVDKDTQEKIDIVKDRMIKSYGYCEICSTEVLNYVASIFARGDAKD